jgi:nucleotide-binding universal stress UspA family protein
MFRTILAPIDLEDLDLAKPALEKAIALADIAGAAVRLLNVRVLMPATYMDYLPETFDEEQRVDAEQRLKDIAANLPLPQARVSSVVRIGAIYPEILLEADTWGADLIVIGSHRPAMATYLLGSNAKTVVRHAKCSVLVVRT